jgi:hypothetical protein
LGSSKNSASYTQPLKAGEVLEVALRKQPYLKFRSSVLYIIVLELFPKAANGTFVPEKQHDCQCAL